jgi:hypothetical protein
MALVNSSSMETLLIGTEGLGGSGAGGSATPPVFRSGDAVTQSMSLECAPGVYVGDGSDVADFKSFHLRFDALPSVDATIYDTAGGAPSPVLVISTTGVLSWRGVTGPTLIPLRRYWLQFDRGIDAIDSKWYVDGTLTLRGGVVGRQSGSIGSITAGTGMTVTIDDVVTWNTTDEGGLSGLVTRAPKAYLAVAKAVGTYNDSPGWSDTGQPLWTTVDERPPNGDEDFIQSDDTGQKRITMLMQTRTDLAIPEGSVVHGVIYRWNAKTTNAAKQTATRTRLRVRDRNWEGQTTVYASTTYANFLDNTFRTLGGAVGSGSAGGRGGDNWRLTDLNNWEAGYVTHDPADPDATSGVAINAGFLRVTAQYLQIAATPPASVAAEVANRVTAQVI